MKNSLLITFLFLNLFSNIFSQEYKKDSRSQDKKDDIYNLYQVSIIEKYEILRALNMAGVNIHKFLLPGFEKSQSIEVTIDEYIDGKISSTQEIFKGNNSYVYFMDSIPTENSTLYVDYIDQLVFYTKETDDEALMTLSTYQGNSSIVILTKRKQRERQFYRWRKYGNIDWRFNEKIPLFIYASSWSDNNGSVERFCGAADLSLDKEATQELLTSSPHYFLINCTIYE